MSRPLSLFMPCLPGTSLKEVASTLDEARTEIDTAFEKIGTVHFSRLLMLDRSQPNLLPKSGTDISDNLVVGVFTEYDGDFNAYISDFATQLGPVFDALLGFVVGGKALIPVADHVQGFQDYITVNDASQHAPNEGFYESYKQTVQKILAVFPQTKP
ncbi:hypothetical protein [Rugamonas sp. DEMB1]|uniref:hypothetical protein n=1 Tax=Rugamonas sp. DEMB1 TaxID=3039386 RepID=UPI00244C5693|nr:hypothetical protein [Rugamonas sp. DEMB1]WGG48266.1 hypothetical protein QC826_16190 [Rugamonas sp. DEMB1]